jgi:hypothetical protein
MLAHLNSDTLLSELWQNALKTASPLEFEPACAHLLRDWIGMGVERMVITNRLTPPDLALACANVTAFVKLMKSEAVFLGHAGRLDKETFRAAHQTLERKSLLAPVAFWPFWPYQFGLRK